MPIALPGETGHVDQPCVVCGQILPAKILRSPAGFYIGTFCPRCGPHSRESGYFRDAEAAQIALDSGAYCR